jgi:hypothetical protein
VHATEPPACDVDANRDVPSVRRRDYARTLGLGADLGATRPRVGTGSAAYLQGLYGAKTTSYRTTRGQPAPRTRSGLRDNEPPSPRPNAWPTCVAVAVWRNRDTLLFCFEDAEDEFEQALVKLRESGAYERLREDLRLRAALDRLAAEVKRIPVELAQARESIWTPEKDKPETSATLWTLGSKEPA